MKMLLIATAALLFNSSAHAQDDEGCYNRLTQDVNCNVIDETDEVPVDLEDPMCVANVDAAGNPYPNADYYVEYFGVRMRKPRRLDGPRPRWLGGERRHGE